MHSTRWRIPIIFAVTLLINYLDRNNLALALPRIAEDFGWSDRQIGTNGELLLAAFFLSYALSNILLSSVAERWGAKRSLIAAILAFSLFTVLCAPLGQSLAALIGLRLLLGLGEGVHIPMLSALTSRWFSASERSRANAIWATGILLATATAPLVIVPLVDAIGWRSTFAILGIVGAIVSIPLVYFLVPETPAVNGLLLPKTEKSLEKSPKDETDVAIERPESRNAETLKGDRTRYTRDKRFWLAVTGGVLNAFCAFGILNWLPTYFNRAKGIEFDSLGWALALVFAAGVVGVGVMAYLGDRLGHRTLLASVGFLLAGAAVYTASTVSSLGWLVLFFAIAVFCQSAYTAQEYAIIQRLLPANRVGAGTGLYNGLSILLGGVGGSLIPGSIVAATGNFNAGMLSIVIGAGLAAIVLWRLSRLTRY